MYIQQDVPDFERGLALFRAAYFFQPFDENHVLNLAHSLYKFAMHINRKNLYYSLSKDEKELIWQLMCESLAAAEMASYLLMIIGLSVTELSSVTVRSFKC